MWRVTKLCSILGWSLLSSKLCSCRFDFMKWIKFSRSCSSISLPDYWKAIIYWSKSRHSSSVIDAAAVSICYCCWISKFFSCSWWISCSSFWSFRLLSMLNLFKTCFLVSWSYCRNSPNERPYSSRIWFISKFYFWFLTSSFCSDELCEK